MQAAAHGLASAVPSQALRNVRQIWRSTCWKYTQRDYGIGGKSWKLAERRFNSIKVVRIEVDVVEAAIASGSAAATHATHLFGPHRRHAVLILQHAIHDEERLLDDDEPIAGKQIRTHDDIGHARLVFEGEKDRKSVVEGK